MKVLTKGSERREVFVVDFVGVGLGHFVEWDVDWVSSEISSFFVGSMYSSAFLS